MNNTDSLQRVLTYCNPVNPSTVGEGAPVEKKYFLSAFVSDLDVIYDVFDTLKQGEKQNIISKLNERIELRKEKESHFSCLTLLIQRIVNFILLRGFATTAERAEIMAARLGNFDPDKKEFWQNIVQLNRGAESQELRDAICESLACFPSINTTYTQIQVLGIAGSQGWEVVLDSVITTQEDFTPQTHLVIWIIRSPEHQSLIERKIWTPEMIKQYPHLKKYTHCYLDDSEYQAMKTNPRLLPKTIYNAINNQAKAPSNS